MAMLNNQRVLAKCVGHVSPPAVCLHPLLALPARAGLKALVVTTWRYFAQSSFQSPPRRPKLSHRSQSINKCRWWKLLLGGPKGVWRWHGLCPDLGRAVLMIRRHRCYGFAKHVCILFLSSETDQSLWLVQSQRALDWKNAKHLPNIWKMIQVWSKYDPGCRLALADLTLAVPSDEELCFCEIGTCKIWTRARTNGRTMEWYGVY